MHIEYIEDAPALDGGLECLLLALALLLRLHRHLLPEVTSKR